MATLLFDNSSSNLKSSKPQLRHINEQYFTLGASSRIIDDKLLLKSNSDDKGDTTLSSTIMNSSNTLNQTNGLEIKPALPATNLSSDKPPHGIVNYLSETSKKKISAILNEVEKLNDLEKLYLYLQLPDGNVKSNENTNNDNKKKVLYNPFGKKTDAEVVQTYTWIQSHLEEDSSVSIPKQEVYEDYRAFCEANKFDKLCVADFGKAMKYIFPQVKPRRLGQRGNSKYCYSGLRKKILVEAPELPVLDTSEYKYCNEDRDIKKNLLVDDVSWNVILEWVEKTFNRKFKSSIDFARHLIETQNIDLSKALKNTENKVNYTKCLVSKNSTAKKKESYYQINKKVTDKKKCDIKGETENSFLSSSATNQVKTNNSNNNNNSITCSMRTNNCSKVDDINQSSDLLTASNKAQTTVKTEPEDIVFSSQTSAVLTKGPITRNSFLSASPTIILLSNSQTIPCETQTISFSNGSTKNHIANHIVSSLDNNSTIKYKPIQSKSIILGSEGESLNSLISTNIDKRRHSVSMPFNVELNKSDIRQDLEGFSNLCSEVKLTDSDKNYKRQIDEKDFHFMSKKRHVEENGTGLVTLPTSILVDNLKTGNIATLESSELKVNDLETEALYDYLNANIPSNVFDTVNDSDNPNNCLISNSSSNNENNESFVQIRKLLENHLQNSDSSSDLGNLDKSNTVLNNIPNLYVDNSSSNSLSSLPKTNYQYNDNTITTKDMSNLDNVTTNCSLINNGQQVPPSPNARRRAFSFQPISPRNTPTIPENSTLDMYGKSATQYNGFNSTQMKQMNSVAVGPSQPSSENNSPFISPRNTPIPSTMSRSRNNSGQSNYSNFRQTPLPSFDSGVSSISTSPFISPQSTPIPAGPSRIRPLDSVNHRNTIRVRHSSGPGGPISRSQVSNVMLYNRSNSLSPMIGENAFLFSNPNFNLSTQSLASANVMDDVKFNQDLANKLNTVSQTNQKLTLDQLQCGFSFHNSNLDLSNQSFQSKSLHRQRHFSNPYGGATTNSALMKPDESESFKMMVNRSQSVPLNQMFQTNVFDPNLSLDPQFASFSSMAPANPGSNNGTSSLDHALTKSYPTTQLCNNDSFKLPHLTSIGTSTSSAANDSLEPNSYLSNSSIEDLLTNDSVISQDLIVSSVQINQGINSGNNDVHVTSAVDDLNVSSPLMLAKTDRDEFNDLLINDSVVEHFQTLDEEFRDCDNDFSNLELENQANTFDEVYKFS